MLILLLSKSCFQKQNLLKDGYLENNLYLSRQHYLSKQLAILQQRFQTQSCKKPSLRFAMTLLNSGGKSTQ